MIDNPGIRISNTEDGTPGKWEIAHESLHGALGESGQ